MNDVPVRWMLLALLAVMTAPLRANTVPAQTYTFSDNDTLSIPLSSLNLNRLVVKDDRINSVVCPVGFCTTQANKSDKSGSVTLKTNVNLPFSIHISTVNGRNVALFVNPKPIPAAVVELVSVQNQHAEPSIFDENFDYPTKLALFTKAMMHYQRDGTLISGFTAHPIDPSTLPTDIGEIAVVPVVALVGRRFSGIIYTVTNQGSDTAHLTNAYFYSLSARSAALDSYTLAPKQSTTLYLTTGGAPR